MFQTRLGAGVCGGGEWRALMIDRVLLHARPLYPPSSPTLPQGKVSPALRAKVLVYKAEHKYSDEEHAEVLAELGYTTDDWNRGCDDVVVETGSVGIPEAAE